MADRNEHPLKAYGNLDFLNSPDARVLRILSEFLEPLRRFRMQGIKDTIVFFGSARTSSRSDALNRYRRVERKVEKARRPSRNLLEELEKAKAGLSIARYYDDAVKLARLLAKWSKTVNHERRFVICSGGGPGIMEAANRGAQLAKAKSVGLNISLPLEQPTNDYVDQQLNFEFHYFFMRKFWFVYLAKALVFFPGGFGTLDEMMEVLTLLQTGKLRKKVSVVVYGSEYWNQVLNFDAMVRNGTISASDLRLFKFADDPEEAFEHLKSGLSKYYLSVSQEKESLQE